LRINEDVAFKRRMILLLVRVVTLVGIVTEGSGKPGDIR